MVIVNSFNSYGGIIVYCEVGYNCKELNEGFTSNITDKV